MSQVTWTIKGNLKVRSQFEEIATKFSPDDPPLEGVLVKVSAKEVQWDPTGFEEWGRAVTKADGSFTITKTKDKSDRFFRVEAQFDQTNVLKVLPANSALIDSLLPQNGTVEQALEAVVQLPPPQWFTVWEDDQKRSPQVVDFHEIGFSSMSGEEADDRTARRHADLWCLAKTMMGKLDALGNGLGYIENRSIAIKYPHKNPGIPDGEEVSYADPVNQVVFLVKNSVRDEFEIQTAMHELMHIRNYQHSTGETNLILQLVLHGTTHDGRQQQTFTAFHEASAEIFKSQLYRLLFGKAASIYDDFPDERRPFTRPWLKAKGIQTLDDIQHFEYGWMSTFNLLLCHKVEELDINSHGPFAEPKNPSGFAVARRTVEFSFADLLAAFDPLPPKFTAQIDTSDMKTSTFFERLGALNPAFDKDLQDAYKKILDPSETGQPSDLLPMAIVPPRL